MLVLNECQSLIFFPWLPQENTETETRPKGGKHRTDQSAVQCTETQFLEDE